MARDIRTRARLVGVAVGVSVVIPLTTFSGSVDAAGTGKTVPTGEAPTVVGKASEPLDEREVVSAAAETRLTATARDLGTLGGEDSFATAIDGDIVVGAAMTPTGRYHAFAYDLGAATPAMIDLGTLGGTSSEATDVSGDIVVGVSRTGPRSSARFFYYDLGAAEPTMVDLGIGFGWTIYGDRWGPFIDDGVIVGQADMGASDQEPRAFAFDMRDGSPRLVNLGTLGGGQEGRYSYATAVDDGVVVGTSTTPAREGGGFAYDLDAETPRMINIGAVKPNDVHQRVIVGYRGLPSDPSGQRGRAFFYRLDAPAPSTVLFGPARSAAKAIDGNVVAGSVRLAGGWHPFAFDLASTTPRLVDLGSLGGRRVNSVAVSGTTVAGTMETTVGARAFGSDLAAVSSDLIDLGTPPNLRGGASAVDVDGDTVVGSVLRRFPHERAVVWTLSTTSAPALEFSRLMYTTPEGDHAATVTVTRTGDASGAATVDYTAAPAGAKAHVDFEPVSGTLALAAGETSQTFTIPILDDSKAEDRDEIALWLTEPEGGVLGTPQMVALRIGASDIRPDGQVREQTDQQFIGDDVYNDTGADQTRRLTASPGQSRTFHVATCTDNDGQPSRRRFPGRFRLHANPATDGSRVRFLRADVDVTPVIHSTRA